MMKLNTKIEALTGEGKGPPDFETPSSGKARSLLAVRNWFAFQLCRDDF